MVVEPTWKHEAASQHFWTFDPVGNGITRVFSQFKLNWPLCFALHHRNTFAHLISVYEVAHLETYQIASTQLAIDRDIKERQISQIVCQFETRSDGPDLFGSQRALCPMMRPLFQARCLGVIAGSCTLGIFCPPYRPPNPSVGIALTMDNSIISITALDLSCRCTMPRMHQTAPSPECVFPRDE